MTHDEAGNSVADAADRVLQFMSDMRTLGQRLDAATTVWELDPDRSRLLRSSDVWSAHGTNTENGLQLAQLGRSKAVLHLFDSGRGLKGLGEEVRQLAVDALEIESVELEPFIELEHRLSTGPDDPSHRMQKEAVHSAMELHATGLEMLRIVPELSRLVDELDRAATTRRRQRRLARIWHPLVQFIVLLGIGVVAVDLVSDRLSSVGSLWVWGFAVASFVAVDYVLEPRLYRHLDRRATVLLQHELDATRQVVVHLPQVLGLLAALASTVPGTDGLMGKVVSMHQQFAPRAEAVLRLRAGGSQGRTADFEDA